MTRTEFSSSAATQSASVTNLQQLLAGTHLPALPQSAIRLLELSQDPENGPAEFAVPIESDPGLTGQVLRFVNSSYFGFSREISSVKLAITLVGVRTIKNFALWSAVFSLMPNPKCGPFDLKSLWQDSLRRGLFARMMGKLMKLKNGEDLFAAALLQDMAVPLLAKELRNEYEELFDERHRTRRRLSDLEEDRFGWNHAEAAGVMARSWSLPIEFAELIEAHTKLDELTANPSAHPGALVVAISSLLPSSDDYDWPEREEFQGLWRQTARPEWPPLSDVLSEIDREFEQFAPVLKIAKPGRTLREMYDM